MRKAKMATMAAVFAGAAAVAVYGIAGGQETRPTPADGMQGGGMMGGGMMHGGMMQGGMMGQHTAEHQQAMPQMGMSKEMETRCRMMMRMTVNPDDPAAVLAIKDTLNLTNEQVTGIQQALDAARHQTDSILTDEQKQTLAGLKDTPNTPMAMHEKMMAMMNEMHGGQGMPGMMGNMQGAQGEAGAMPMSCPMMSMMQNMQHGAAPGTEGEASATTHEHGGQAAQDAAPAAGAHQH